MPSSITLFPMLLDTHFLPLAKLLSQPHHQNLYVTFVEIIAQANRKRKEHLRTIGMGGIGKTQNNLGP
jgi:hypothetical protein